jgi:hypothetical protein
VTSPNTIKDSQVRLVATVGRDTECIYGVVDVHFAEHDDRPQTFYADPDCPEEVSAFYDDVTHAIRQSAKTICEAVYELSAFQPALFS